MKLAIRGPARRSSRGLDKSPARIAGPCTIALGRAHHSSRRTRISSPAPQSRPGSSLEEWRGVRGVSAKGKSPQPPACGRPLGGRILGQKRDQDPRECTAAAMSEAGEAANRVRKSMERQLRRPSSLGARIARRSSVSREGVESTQPQRGWWGTHAASDIRHWAFLCSPLILRRAGAGAIMPLVRPQRQSARHGRRNITTNRARPEQHASVRRSSGRSRRERE